MPSTTPLKDAHFLDSRGEKTSLAGITVNIFDVDTDTALTTAVINSDSQVPATAVSVDVGSVVRIRVAHDGHGRAGYFEVVTE